MSGKQRKQRQALRDAMNDNQREKASVLRFSPYAWAKLWWFCQRGAPDHQTEIGGFGIAAAEDPLLIEDFVTVKQTVSCVSVAFDDEAVAEFFDRQVDLGLRPQQFARVWLHTHPGSSPNPSAVDEETFARVFGTCDWAVMFILAEKGPTYARLRFNVGPGGQTRLVVKIDWSRPFPAADQPAWEAEYQANIHPDPEIATASSTNAAASAALMDLEEAAARLGWDLDPEHDPTDAWAEFEAMAMAEDAEAQLDLDLLDESEVLP